MWQAKLAGWPDTMDNCHKSTSVPSENLDKLRRADIAIKELHAIKPKSRDYTQTRSPGSHWL